ncbi:hypothetical protein DV738_g3098, partial [Chaetothyriales sp. CBS 135597]
MEGTPLKAEYGSTQKAKRRRTSPHDHAILEAAYQANSKPSKEERANLVRQVQLGEKEVQIWFQNRRQNDRRRSKPLQPHELIAHLANSSPNTLTPDSSQVSESTTARGPVPSHMSPAVSPAVSPNLSLTSQSDVASRPSSQSSDAAASVVKVKPSTEALAVAGQPQGLEQVQTWTGSSTQSSPATRAATPPSSGRKRNRGEMEQTGSSEASSALPQAEAAATATREPLKRSSSVRLAMTVDGAVKIKTNDELTPSPEKARALPPGLTEEGRQRRLSRSISMASDSMSSIKSSRQLSTFGRSRDPRKWEFFCDNSADDALSVQAEAEISGSAIGAINLIRSSSLKGRGLAMSPVPSRGNVSLSKQARSKLVRAKSSFARLNSQPEPTLKGGSRASRHVRAPSDSDKENWAPGTTVSEHPLRRTQPSTNRRPVLQDNEAVIFPDATTNRPRDLAASAHNAQKNGFDHDDMLGIWQQQRRPEVAIIGAGIAGLRCAAVLLRSGGANVTVFEARDQRTKTAVLSPEESGIVFDSHGNRKTASESQQLSATTWGLIVEAFQHSDEHSAEIDPGASLADFFSERLLKLQDAINESRMWGQFIGAPIERQSLKFFFLEECVDGENVFVASTYRSILDEIARPVLQAGVVRFGAEVTNVELVDDGGVRLTTTTATTPYSSTTSTYDEVVVTCPLGWLKQHGDTFFTPPLPPRLTRAISNISYGQLEKVYITFPTACEPYNAFLTTFAQPFYSKLPNYSPASAICRPTACLATTWSADAYAGNGSYSNFQVGLEHADRDIEEMRNAGGLCEREGGGLWLAGEHTAPFIALGTTTGAWWSGEAVARRICQKQRLRVDQEEA